MGDATAPDTHEALLQRALAQDPGAVRALLSLLLPVVRSRALLACRRYASALRSDADQEVDDLTQEVLVTLFAEDARVLRSWDRSRGLSLRNFVGLVCSRRIHAILRAGKQGASPEELTRDGEFEMSADEGTEEDKFEVALASRQLFSRVLDQLRVEVSARGMALFHALLIEERSIDSIRVEFEMSADAVYAWRSRLLRRARVLARELDDGPTQSDFPPAAPIRMKAGAS